MSDAMYAAVSLYKDPRFFSESEIRIRNNKIRRRRIVRRQFALLMLVLTIIVFALVFMANSFMSDAQSDNFTPEYKYYKSVTVHTGDTIWDIASDNYSAEHYDNIAKYISEIKELNNISDTTKVYAGECIVIPYYAPFQ